jgi:hypothetical protein
MTKEKCASYFNISGDIDYYCTRYSCVYQPMKDYLDSGRNNNFLDTSCIAENYGETPYWYDTNSKTCYGYYVSRAMSQTDCDQKCLAILNTY